MNDRTVTRAARFGTKTTPVESKARPKQIKANADLTPDEIATAMQMARSDRIEQDIQDYAGRKRATS